MKIRTLLLTSLIFPIVPILSQSPLATAAETRSPTHNYRIANAHLHFVDFLQKTDGIQALIARMDQTGVDHTMISGMPLVKKWGAADPCQPHYLLDNDSPLYWYSATDVLVARAVLSLSARQRARFHPFICGFNSTDAVRSVARGGDLCNSNTSRHSMHANATTPRLEVVANSCSRVFKSPIASDNPAARLRENTVPPCDRGSQGPARYRPRLDHRLGLLGTAQMAVSEVDAFQRFLNFLQGCLERVIAGDNRLAGSSVRCAHDRASSL
jgi:hypothetical protein